MKEHVYGEKAMGKMHEGTHWVRLEQEKEKKIVFKQVRTTSVGSDVSKCRDCLSAV